MMETIITGGISLASVALGGFIGWGVEWRREKRSRTDRAYYLAVRVSLVLDEYSCKCQDFIMGDRVRVCSADPNGIPLPEAPTLPDDVDWKSIDGELMYEILTLPRKIKEAERRIRSYEKRYEDSRHDKKMAKDAILILSDDTNKEYCDLNRMKFSITKQLRGEYIQIIHKIPEEQRNPESGLTLSEYFEGTNKEIHERRAKRQKEKDEREAQIPKETGLVAQGTQDEG